MRTIKENFEDKARLVGDISDFIDALEHPLENEDDKERQVSIERALIVYEMGIKDGVNEWLKTNKGK